MNNPECPKYGCSKTKQLPGMPGAFICLECGHIFMEKQ
jgi:hypothetical protein